MVCGCLPDVQVRSLCLRLPTVLVPPGFELGLHGTEFPACILRVRVVLAGYGFLDLDAAFPFADAALKGSLPLPELVIVGIFRVGGDVGEAGQVDRLRVCAVGVVEAA